MSSYRFKRREKSLGLSCGFESTHSPFPHPRRSMRVLGSIVQSFMLSVFHSFENFFLRCTVALKFVGDDHPWCKALRLKEFSKKLVGCSFIPTRLHQYIKDLPILVHGTPEIILLPLNLDDDFIEMPFIRLAFIRPGAIKLNKY